MKKLILAIACLINLTTGDYWTDREKLIQLDRASNIGSTLNLTEKETIADAFILNLKKQELQVGFNDPKKFPSALHFFKSRPIIETSPIFNIITRLPKGSSLHSHDLALTSQEYLYNQTFRENLYACLTDDTLLLHFFNPNNISTSCEWTLLKDLRENRLDFEEFLKSKMSIVRDDPVKAYPTINEVWKGFQQTFRTVVGLITYKPVFEGFFYQALRELRDDNVKYAEIRGYLPHVYDLDGRLYDEEEVVGIYENVTRRFKEDFTDFVGAKFIYAPNRRVTNNTMEAEVQIYKKIRSAYADFVVGFDLVGQEDKGWPLGDYIPQLLEIRSAGGHFYFHAGETNWFGFASDEDLFDAVLLNATRLGHAYALLKHPALAEAVKSRGIAVEVCPISNQVLKLVDDLRNHPAAVMIADGYPVVVAPDDPGFWGARGLSYDWYVAFMGMTSKGTGLRFLKQLALNSITYSSLNATEMAGALKQWKVDWDDFVDGLVRNEYFGYNEVLKVV
ncbi:unnamed protein product [Phyllotreta striolata]|uniref:Adenosine deaminase n=1 Tax=Phyllotreta striolata TaxID=444603 RepID=A0A9P0GN72_PHYSR|nr:unnamed protein product [Phyllotreta striolata]